MSEERDDATEATFTEEEFIHPLDGLIERTKTDPTAPFEAAEGIAELKQTDPIAYQKLRARLMRRGISQHHSARRHAQKNHQTEAARRRRRRRGLPSLSLNGRSERRLPLSQRRRHGLCRRHDRWPPGDLSRQGRPVPKLPASTVFPDHEKRPAGGGVEHRHRHRRGTGRLFALSARSLHPCRKRRRPHLSRSRRRDAPRRRDHGEWLGHSRRAAERRALSASARDEGIAGAKKKQPRRGHSAGSRSTGS